jgi:hypothetical protein
MQIEPQDLAVIEQALKQAIAGGADYQEILTYQEVLNKLHGKKAQPSTTLQVDAGLPPLDGFRYDYDDSSDISKKG